MYKKLFATALKKAREEKKLSQRELAEKTGIPQSTIAKLETGEQNPDLKKLNILCDYFGKSADYFLGRKSDIL